MSAKRSRIDFTGVHIFSVTPTETDGALAPGKLAPHIDRALDAGIASITVFGSTGAIGSFSESERRELAEAAVGHTAGRAPVIVGTGAMTTAESVRLSIHARDIGADAILVVPITYWPLTEKELTEHYRTIAEAADLPMILYNNPRTTGVDMSPAFLASLCEITQVVAVKESAPDVSRIAELVRLTTGRIPVLTGRDPQILDALLVGASGWFSGGANFMPYCCVELFQLMKAGKVNEARVLFTRIQPLVSFALAKGGIRCSHTALDLQNHGMGAPRKPLQALETLDREQLRELMVEAGLL